MTVKLYTVDDAIKMAKNEVSNYGFILISRGARSFYYKRANVAWRIRIADHPRPTADSDIAADIVFKSPTTQADIEWMVKNAVRQYDMKATNPRTKKKTLGTREMKAWKITTKNRNSDFINMTDGTSYFIDKKSAEQWIAANVVIERTEVSRPEEIDVSEEFFERLTITKEIHIWR